MATLKMVGERKARIACDCGSYVHELSSDKDGKLTIESIKTGKGKTENGTQTKTKKRTSGFFDPPGITGSDDDEGNNDDGDGSNDDDE